MTTYVADQLLDCSGLNCPLPILKTKKALAALPPGGVLEVRATDPGAVKDFEAFCRSTGNQLLDSRVEGKTYVFLIRHTA
jgi:tRNA 2-thiouridine synthesizing protein A